MNQPVVSALAGRHSFQNITTNTTTVVKSGNGVLHTLTVGRVGTTSTVTIYDNTVASGTLIGTFATTGVLSFVVDARFGNGLTLVTAGAAAADITVTYV